MKKMYHWVSGIPLAITLITSTMIFVIIGTFIESKTSSHAQAASWTYQNPFFYLLLSGFFVNILLSALNRYPFKRKHIPFLITHLGLLLVIVGLFIKSLWGIQGHLFLIEGASTNQVTLPGTYALRVETKDSIQILPLQSDLFKGYFLNETLPFKIAQFKPHVEEQLIGWLDSKTLRFFDHPPLPINKTPTQILLNKKLETLVWARKNNHYEQTLQEVINDPLSQKFPFLLIHQDDLGKTILSFKQPKEKLQTEVFEPNQINKWNVYDQGYQGYSVQADFKLNIASNALQAIKQELRDHQKNLYPFSPPLELISRSCKVHQLEFADCLINYLHHWQIKETWLDSSFPLPISWNILPEDEKKALYWIALLYQDDLMTALEKMKWPLIESLKKIEDPDVVKITWMKQLYSIKEQLPLIPDPLDRQTSSKMLTALLRLYTIHLNEIPMPETSNELLSLEAPLNRRMIEKKAPTKLEEMTPCIYLKYKQSVIPLVYDSKGTKLKWPLGDRHTLLKFQPEQHELPFEVRLHKATVIKYPDTEQTLSYECLLSIDGVHQELRMNQVYESTQGYRLYLAGIGTIDPFGAKSAQIVVNKDPAKYYLTYPGALLVGLGILLLFWKSR